MPRTGAHGTRNPPIPCNATSDAATALSRLAPSCVGSTRQVAAPTAAAAAVVVVVSYWRPTAKHESENTRVRVAGEANALKQTRRRR
jgi:hypothetical protein